MRPLESLAFGVDALARRAIAWRSPASRRRSRSESLGPAARVEALAAIAAAYGDDAAIADVDVTFGAPIDVAMQTTRRGDVLDISWDSGFAPLTSRDTYLALHENRRAHARVHRQRGSSGKQVALLLHGYGGGGFDFEARVGERAFYASLGLDTVLFVLPHHGLRSRPGLRPRFPSSDPRITNEALRQAIWDLRHLVRHLRTEGAEQIVVHGTSLGGYVASLLGTVEPVDALVPMIPLASFADVALENGRFVGTHEEQQAQYAGLERAHRAVSPFARAPRVAPERVIVVAGEVDQVTGMAHAKKIATHYQSELVRFRGGHLVQLGKEGARRRVKEKLAGLGIGR